MIAVLNANTHANDVRMRRTLFKGSFLLVEGWADEKFFGKFTDSTKCQILICDGKDKVLGACQILEENSFEGVVGIIDADFAPLDFPADFPEMVFMTDGHDAEGMMLCSPAFDALLVEFCQSAKLDKWRASNSSKLIEELVKEASKIGYFLWFSLKKDLGLNFDKLKFKEFTDENSFEIDIVNLVTHVKDRSNRKDIIDDDLLGGISEMQKKSSDVWQVARGHDVLEILGLGLRTTLGSCDHSESCVENIESHLRVAYTPEMFSSTSLFAAVRTHVAKTPQFQVFIV